MKVVYVQILKDGSVLQADTTYDTPLALIRRVTGGLVGVHRLSHPGNGGPGEWTSVQVKDLYGELAKIRALRCSFCHNNPMGCPARQQVLKGKPGAWKFDCKQHALFLETCLKRKT
jgi:hypothetical protein